MSVPLEASPHDRVRHACARWGEYELVGLCADVLAGVPADDDPDLLLYLGGRHARALVEQRLPLVYWPRVWAARALLYAWDPAAGGAVALVLTDEAWRVREMAAKVVALRELGEAADAIAALLADPVPRVRSAAVRAAGAVGEIEHADAVRDLLDDPEPDVRRQAERALRRLAVRLDREV